MNAKPIQALAVPVPVCDPQDPLVAVIEQLKTAQAGWLLIWDSQPIGALPIAPLSQLMASLIHGLTQSIPMSADPLVRETHGLEPPAVVRGEACLTASALHELANHRGDADLSLLQLIYTPLETLLKQRHVQTQLVPLQVVPANWTVSQLRAYLHRSHTAAENCQWVVIDSDHCPVGMLPPAWIETARGHQESPESAPQELLAVKELTAQNADLRQINQLKTDYLAYISHEVKNPITALLGLSELLLAAGSNELRDGHSSPPSSGDRQQHYIRLIQHNSRRLAAIANTILDLSRIELGHLQLSPQQVSIRQVCDRAWQRVSRHVLHPDIDAVAPPTVTIQPGLYDLMADEQRLAQMLTHLLANACIATASSGQMGLTVALWGQWCAFTVWNTGVGIPPERQPLLMQTLQALENPRTHSLEETGIGLVLTQRLADLQGGDLTFLSDARRSEFTLLLPWDTPHGNSLESPRAAQSRKPLVVVVDDAVSSLSHLAQALGSLGYGVVVARSGTEALRKIRLLHPQVIFLSPELPLLSGWDVLALLKADRITDLIPVILTTSATAELPSQRQADAVMVIPSSPSVIARTIAGVIAPQTCSPDSLGADGQGPTPSASPPPEAVLPVPLTVLYFNPVSALHAGSTIDFNSLLHPYGCRVLEVDDPEQADLVAQVWQPHVVLLSLSVPPDVAYLGQLSQLSDVGLLPMVVINPDVAAAGHRAGLSIYPCLISVQALKTEASVDMSLLVQVIRVAASAR